MLKTSSGNWANQLACDIGIRHFSGFEIGTILLKFTQWLLYVFAIIQQKSVKLNIQLHKQNNYVVDQLT